MKTLRGRYPVTLMSRVFDVSKSGYCTGLKRPPSKRTQDNARLAVAITENRFCVFRTSALPGGRRWPTCAPDKPTTRIACRMSLRRTAFMPAWAASNLSARSWESAANKTRKFKATTNSIHALPVAENLLKQDFSTQRPHQGWVTDIIYIPTREGWLYLAGIKICTRARS